MQATEGSAFLTIEALATFIARIVTMEFDIDEVTVSVEKPSALATVEGAGVKLTRSKSFFEQSGLFSNVGS